MDRWTEWWKKDKRYMTCLRAAVLACLPILGCVLYCSLQGKSIGQVYLPASGRNDELLYYKQVEAMLDYGYPQGYFGYNESRALRLSFGAWSPLLVLPWLLWGLVFGWDLLSPVICNIFLLTLSLFLFALLAKPRWKQIGITAFLYLLYPPFSWYMMSGMPEINCISLLLVFYGMAAAYLRERKGSCLAGLFVLAGLLTLMRPYMLLFLFLPACLWIFGGREGTHTQIAGAGRPPSEQAPRRGIRAVLRFFAARWKAILGSAAIMAVVLAGYAWISHFLAAEYFEPLFYADWLTAFFQKGLLGGLRNFFGSLYYSLVEFWRYMVQGVRTGLPAGAVFCCYVVMFLTILYQVLRDGLFLYMRRKNGAAAGSPEDGADSGEEDNSRASADGARNAGDRKDSGEEDGTCAPADGIRNAGNGKDSGEEDGTCASADGTRNLGNGKDSGAGGPAGQLVLEAHLAFSFFGMLMAQLLMYNFYDGCKHLMTFLAVGIFIVGMMETAYFKKAVLIGAAFSFFFIYHGDAFRDYQVSFSEPEITAEMERWEAALGEELVLEEGVGYDNVVIWLLSDEFPEGLVYTGWQYLYALPSGFGISCCTADYVTEHFEELQSRYLCVAPGGPVEEECIRMEYEKIAGNEYAAVYRRF